MEKRDDEKNVYFEPLDNDVWVVHGSEPMKPPEQEPLPEDLALGNLVRLHKPYKQFDHGIIVEHIGYNARGTPHVSLHLWNQQGELHVMKEGPQTPHYVDFVATEFEVIRVAKTR